MKATVHTHETYVQAVRDLAIARGLESGRITDEQASQLRAVKLVYGLGLRGGYRGVTTYGTWQNGGPVPTDAVEITATGEENWLQLACTTVHELAHVLGGHGAGHSDAWKGLCDRLGLRRAKAAGMRYSLAALDPTLRERVYALAATVKDGGPTFMQALTPIRMPATPRPCSAGIGTRGGTSRGAGSGSRLLKVQCDTCGYVVRVTRSWLDKGAPLCGAEQGAHGPMAPRD